jgi:hypothetical protein
VRSGRQGNFLEGIFSPLHCEYNRRIFHTENIRSIHRKDLTALLPLPLGKHDARQLLGGCFCILMLFFRFLWLQQ